MEATATPTVTKVHGEQLSGEELLSLVQSPENQNADEDTILRAAGYYIDTLDESGEVIKTSWQRAAFYEAYAAAKGLTLPAKKKSSVGAPAGPRNFCKVAKTSGKIVISGGHAAAAGFNEGDKVKIDASEGQIIVTLLEKAASPACPPKMEATTEEADDDGEFLDDEEGFDLD